MGYFDNRAAIDRLKREYREHNGKLVIGFDFDNTIYDYHRTGIDVSPIVDLLVKCSNLGFTMCLYSIISTEVDDMNTDDKKDYCISLGINVDYINNSPVTLGCGKPFFNILLDDRAGLISAFEILHTALVELDLIDAC